MACAPTRVCLPLILLRMTAVLASGVHGLVAPGPSDSPSYPALAAQVSKLPICPTPFAANSSNTVDTAPLWDISDWSTDYTVPDGGSIIFRLVNALTGYDALCFRRGLYPEGYCMQAITDGNEGGGGEEPSEGEDTTGTIFQYYDKIGFLQIYQEWDCGTGDGTTTKRVQADGNITVIATDLCKAGDSMKQGEMCGIQGGAGKVFPTLVEVN